MGKPAHIGNIPTQRTAAALVATLAAAAAIAAAADDPAAATAVATAAAAAATATAATAAAVAAAVAESRVESNNTTLMSEALHGNHLQRLATRQLGMMLVWVYPSSNAQCTIKFTTHRS